NRKRTLSALGEYSSPIASPGHEERLPLNGIGLRTLAGTGIYTTKTARPLFPTDPGLAPLAFPIRAIVLDPVDGVVVPANTTCVCFSLPAVILNTSLQTAEAPPTCAPARPPSVKIRKSTRLNSSHVSISYAVFCLKK